MSTLEEYAGKVRSIIETIITENSYGINIDKLAQSSCSVIGIAGDERKAAAILGALRGGFLDVLITDTHAARAVIEMNGGNHKR